MTIGALLVAPDLNFAARAFRLSTWHLMAVIPVAYLAWKPVTLNRADRLSFYFCSGYDFQTAAGTRAYDNDIAGVGCS